MGKIILTGDRPTGRLHVGYYVGSLRRRVELQNSGEYEKIYISLIESKIIDETVEKNPGMKEQDIAGAAVKISKNYPLDLRILRRLIRIQVQRTGNNPINDMDYDLQLKEAMKIVKDPNFTQLIKNTKTLKQLQEEVEAANAADENK